MFIRKVHPEFPDEILRKYICEKNDDSIKKNEYTYKIIKIKSFLHFFTGILLGLCFVFWIIA